MINYQAFLLFLKGALIGFSIAAPVGPIGVICIRRTLSRGMANGFVSGLGAASADACYGVIAAAGITSISTLLVNNAVILRSAGGFFLLYLGVKTFIAGATSMNSSVESFNPVFLMKSYTSIFFLTITNPMTIISFSVIFAGLGLSAGSGSVAGAVFMVAGVFSGSASWWLILSSIFGLVKMKITEALMISINRLSGTIIIAFGLLALVSIYL